MMCFITLFIAAYIAEVSNGSRLPLFVSISPGRPLCLDSDVWGSPYIADTTIIELGEHYYLEKH